MAELLFELRSEEIPAGMQARAAAELERLVTAGLAEAGLAFTHSQAFATPRRLALVVDGIPRRQPDRVEERRGPRIDAPEKAIQGFLRAVGLDSVDQCDRRETERGTFLFHVVEIEGRPTAEVLPELLVSAVAKLHWPKSMRWGRTRFRWVRPLHGVLAVFAGRPLKGGLDLGGEVLTFTNRTAGHRFLAPRSFAVRGFADYRRKLRERKVILDAADRRVRIERELRRKAATQGMRPKDDPALIDEVAGLVEWPVVLLGEIESEFMALPPEVLTASMRAHQRYFTLLREDGQLAPRFAMVANMATRDRGQAIRRGNERVLRARLSDAKFFWDQDRGEPLAARVPALDGIVFHARLGSLGDKVERMQALAVEIAAHLPGAAEDRVRRAARLAKADLVTGMVGEFPELQGVMGRYYALHDGEEPEVADAIAEHYAPQGPNDRCPRAPVSVAVALADKIDSLVGFWTIDEKPTGSRDPYALRRAALGVIRLVVENGLRLPMRSVFRTAGSLHGCRDWDPEDLLGFFADRLKVHLRERGVRHDLIAAVFALTQEDDLVRLLARVDALRRFLETEDGGNLLVAYRRAANIVAIEERRDKASYTGDVDPGAFVQAEEKRLAAALERTAKKAVAAVKRENFEAAMTALSALRRPVDAFFDRVTVNVEDAKLRANRLRLLSRIRATMNEVADFSQIEG